LGARRVGFLSHELLAGNGAKDALAALDGADLAVESITHVFFAGPLSADKQEWRAARDRLLRLIDIAASLQARSIYMLTGGHGAGAWEASANNFCEAIAPCVEQARAAGVELAVENASSLYAELHIAHSLADTLQLAEMADIGVCIELFFCWAEARLPELFERAMPRCRLVQVSDYIYGDRSLPARAVPGDGVIPLGRIIGQLLDAGYDGAFDLELLGPRIDGEGAAAAVARAASFVEQVLIDRGA
jgi:sugar phosphate isomerase/epimerase